MGKIDCTVSYLATCYKRSPSQNDTKYLYDYRVVKAPWESVSSRLEEPLRRGYLSLVSRGSSAGGR